MFGVYPNICHGAIVPTIAAGTGGLQTLTIDFGRFSYDAP